MAKRKTGTAAAVLDETPALAPAAVPESEAAGVGEITGTIGGTAVGTEVRLLEPAALIPWPALNNRTSFDAGELAELEASIRAKGVLQPLLVHDPGEPGPLWIVAGERRWRAAAAAGVPVPCVVRTWTLAEAIEVCLTENLQRSNLTPLEEARGFQRWLEATGEPKARLAELLGIDRSQVSNRVRLLQLPDVALALLEEGFVDVTTARDVLVPFAQLAEPVRTRFYQQATSTVRSWARGRRLPLAAHTVRSAIVQVARSLSRPISGHEYEQHPPRFDPKEHETCTCGGPLFEYGGQKEVRCFDETWWKAAQDAAEKRLAEAERKAAEKLAAAGAAAVREMSHQAFNKQYRWDQYAYLTRDLIDPAELAEAAFVVVNDGVHREVRCVDMPAVKRAKSAATRERNRLLKERRAERAAKDLEEAAKLDLEPWMLGQLLTARPDRDKVMDVGRELGFETGKHGQVDEAVRKLPADQVTTLFKVLALRSKRGDLVWQDPLEQKVDEQLRRKYSPSVKALEKKILDAAAEAKPAKVKRKKAAEPSPRPYWLGSGEGWEFVGYNKDEEPQYRRRVLKEGKDLWQLAWGTWPIRRGESGHHGGMFQRYDGPADRPQYTWSQLDLYVDQDATKGYVGADRAAAEPEVLPVDAPEVAYA